MAREAREHGSTGGTGGTGTAFNPSNSPVERNLREYGTIYLLTFTGVLGAFVGLVIHKLYLYHV